MNGKHFLHYHYRLPLSRVDTLGIFGDVLVKAVGFLNINVSVLELSPGWQPPLTSPFLLLRLTPGETQSTPPLGPQPETEEAPGTPAVTKGSLRCQV